MITRGFTNNTILTRGFASSGVPVVVIVKYIYAKSSSFLVNISNSTFVKQSSTLGSAFIQNMKNIISSLTSKDIITNKDAKDTPFNLNAKDGD